jgi:hypothetical protein
MLLPNERIASDGEQVVIVFDPKRPQLDEFPFQDRLIIERHGTRVLSALDSMAVSPGGLPLPGLSPAGKVSRMLPDSC